MHVDIAESRELAHAHAAYSSQAVITTEGALIGGTSDLVFWTAASAKGQQQSGPSGAAVVLQIVDKNGRVVWQDATFGVSGQQKTIHEVELLAMLYALAIALFECIAKTQGKPDQPAAHREAKQRAPPTSRQEEIVRDA